MPIRRFVWGALLSLFFLSTLTLSFPLGKQFFVSPDENSAFIFAKNLVNTGTLHFSEPLNEPLGGIVHPRSAVGYDGAIVPGSFIGFVYLLAGVGAVFGKLAMYFVTPLFAVLTVLLWRDSIFRLFHHPTLADFSAFLLMIHPAFWYYSGRVMMHNIAFLALLVAGLWWCLATPLSSRGRKKYRTVLRWGDFTIAGLFFGAALVLRTSEILWLTLSLAAFLVVYRKVLGWRAIVWFASGFLFMLCVLGGVNTVVYGSPLVNGYTVHYPYQTNAAIESGDVVSGSGEEPRPNYLLPFGFHERVILDNVIHYGWDLYPWMSVLSALGLVLVFTERNEDNKNIWQGLAIFTLGLATWLGILYGSWKIIDNPDPSIISLGNSHVRYWLPLFALASVFGAKTLVYLLGDRSLPRKALVGIFFLVISLMSTRLVFFGQDGFLPTRRALATFAVKQDRILADTEDDAIVVVDRADKYLFPERRVVVPLRSDKTYAALPTMLEYVPVYYFGITLPQKDIDYLNSQKLEPLQVRIELVETIQEESLYRFVVAQHE